MSPNSHFKELLSAFDRCEVKYLIVGGYAVMRHTEPRFTKDLDVWVEASDENAARVYRALAEFGAPLTGVQPADFAKDDLIYQLGVAPVRIDVLTSITGVEFPEAWARRCQGDFGGAIAQFIGKEDLMRNKRATGRAVDLVDYERLEEAAEPE